MARQPARNREADLALMRDCIAQGMDYQQMADSTGMSHERLYYLHFVYLRAVKIPYHNAQQQAARKLSDNQVRLIRQALAIGETQRNLATLFDVCQATIQNIGSGLLYKDVV